MYYFPVYCNYNDFQRYLFQSVSFTVTNIMKITRTERMGYLPLPPQERDHVSMKFQQKIDLTLNIPLKNKISTSKQLLLKSLLYCFPQDLTKIIASNPFCN